MNVHYCIFANRGACQDKCMHSCMSKQARAPRCECVCYMCVRSTLSSAHLSARPPSLSKPHLPPLQASLLQKVSPVLAARTLRVSRTAALAAASALRPAQSLSPAGDPPPPRPPHTPHAARRPMLALPLPPSRSWAPLGEEGESAASPWCSYHPASLQAGSRCTTAWKHLPRVRDGCTGLSGPGPACCAEPRAAPVSPDSSLLPGRNPPVCNVGTRARGLGVGCRRGSGLLFPCVKGGTGVQAETLRRVGVQEREVLAL